MASLKRRRKETRDRHREFIYLDDVSVVSLLAGLQGEINESVKKRLAESHESGMTSSAGTPKGTAGVEARFGSTRSSSSEVVRRAVIQSTFRDLWRRDVGVLLHDISGVKHRHRKPLISARELEKAIPRLKKAKRAVGLHGIRRGDIVEMDVRIEADHLFKMVTVGTTFLDLMDGREDLFGISANDLRKVAPMIEVLRDLSVGLVPMRGTSTSHCVIEVQGERLVIAKDLLADDLANRIQRLELVGFAETESFWRDLRRTLFSGATYTSMPVQRVPPWTCPGHRSSSPTCLIPSRPGSVMKLLDHSNDFKSPGPLSLKNLIASMWRGSNWLNRSWAVQPAVIPTPT